jgi:DnaJ-class molecular chaperone
MSKIFEKTEEYTAQCIECAGHGVITNHFLSESSTSSATGNATTICSSCGGYGKIIKQKKTTIEITHKQIKEAK